METIAALCHYLTMKTDLIISFLQTVNIIDLAIIFILNAFSTATSTLKTIFILKKLNQQVYVVTFLDAMIFAYSFKLVANTSGIACIIVFAAGRLFGICLSNYIDAKLAYGDIEVEIYKHPQNGIALADYLREIGYSVTTYIGYGIGGKERMVISIITPRKQFPALKKILAADGKINMSIKDIGKTYGKVGQIQV
ncbi:hypothetical protein [Syntrophomonas palmitatica]|uniref:hypothetical protein n=1 Tax=Syntrophomonas palmitatica TaxID=402877 RepID=UPI0006D2AEA6|nr:hypothetical protein [Syntrophomonas palmitatica]